MSTDEKLASFEVRRDRKSSTTPLLLSLTFVSSPTIDTSVSINECMLISTRELSIRCGGPRESK